MNKEEKIFILTGEPSGDKLASRIIAKLKSSRPDIEYLSVGGEHLKALGIKSLYDLKEITYLGFTNVLLNLFKIKKKINETVDKIIEFNPDILFSVDSPDFTLRVVERVRKLKSEIKTIHYVAPQVWVWREHRTKRLKKFLDHILLLFPFEKKYFDKENINCTFVGHPLLEDDEKIKIDINNIISENKKIISIFSGSRSSEVDVLLPILIKFIKTMKEKYEDIHFVFHTTKEHRQKVTNQVEKEELGECDVISDEKIKSYILKKSMFAVAKSGTVSLEICKAKVPSIIIYKMNFVNYFIIKMLVKIKFANIINIAADKEIIPELLQEKCNSKNIFIKVDEFLSNPELSKKQISEYQEIIQNFKTERSSEIASSVLINSL
jgi:lipid-A-disaccharide synthase